MPSLFDPAILKRAVDRQSRSYRLLKWVAVAVKDGFISFRSAHQYATFPEAAEAWILEHFQNIPPNARVEQSELKEFSLFFSTYLDNSFDLVESPGRKLYSPDAHCFCPMCSWMVEAPNLKTKKLSAADKKRAERLCVDAIQKVASLNRLECTNTTIEVMLKDETMQENAALVAYGCDLMVRLAGVATGPAVLALWRRFAWNRTGSPKRKYQLKSGNILDAEQQIVAALNAPRTS